jgi:aminopeptidase YwaD
MTVCSKFKVQSSKWAYRKLMLFSLLTVNCQLSTVNCLAQDVDRAKAVVYKLASPTFYGRGYVQKGDSLAAEFLAAQFRQIGLKSIDESYFQAFRMSVNTFPSKVEFKVGKTKLVPGLDYILNPASRSISGSFEVMQVDSTHFILNAIRKEENSVVKVFVSPKLTYSVSQKEGDPAIVVRTKTSLLLAKKAKVKIENTFIPHYAARNVLGYIEGTSKKDSFLLISAHYDHLGMMGNKTYFPGANDNASGVAMMLEMARYFALPENRLPYSILFIGFAAEEAGLVGSKFFTEHPLVPLPNIKFMLNLDLMGSGKEGITVVNGTVFPQEFASLDSLNKTNNLLVQVKPRGKAANSDHYHFSEKGVPAFFIYTMGEIKAYHDVFDRPEVVTFSRFKECFELVRKFLKAF